MSNKVTKDNLTVNFSTDWFTHNIPSLSYIFEQFTPQRILEIGSFEGRSTHFFTEEMLKYHNEIEIHCIDSWEGGLEHQGKWDMGSVEQSFNENIQTLMIYAKQCRKSLNIIKHKGYSHTKMIELLAKGEAGKFDFIYVDGSHEAPDVLFDAILAHKLVKNNGIIAFDDYLWSPEENGKQNYYHLVKPAVDAYVNIYQQKLHVLQMLPVYQLYIQKLSD